jgi:hypothetical protein
MRHVLILVLCAGGAWAQSSLHGTVTDPSGAAVPNAAVALDGPAGGKHARTDTSGEYLFSRLAPGKYSLKVTAKGFAVTRKDLAVDGAAVCDIRLAIQTTPQSIRVEARNGRVSTEPDANGSAVVMGKRQIAALSDNSRPQIPPFPTAHNAPWWCPK